MGDLLCAFPAMCAVRRQYPSAHLVVLTSPGLPGLPGAKSVLGSVEWIDEFIEYFPSDMSRPQSARKIIRDLRARKFDIFIELPNDMARMRTLFRNMLFARLTGAKWAGGWSIGTIRVCLKRQSEEIQFPDETGRLLQAINECGISCEGIDFRLPISPSSRDAAERLLASFGLESEAALIALAPGAKRSDNRWPLDRFAEVGRELVARGFRVLVIGSKDEYDSARQLCEAVGSHCFNLAGLTSIPESGAILERCRLAVCNDSGVQHLSSAVGTPPVAIFSFWQLRGKWFPHHPRAVVLQKQVACHTCYLNACPVGNQCVMGITSQEVTEAVFQVMDEPVSAETKCDAGPLHS